jgi:hypothetical protein
MDVVRELAALPHRGACTDGERKAADLLEARLVALGAAVRREPFITPRSYIWEVCWALAALITGLLGVQWAPWPAAVLALAGARSAWLFLDYRWTPLMLLPPRGRSENIVATRARETDGGKGAPLRLVVMGHYDSAPCSLLYHPSMVKSFHSSLLVNLGVIALAAALVVLAALGIGPPALAWARWALAAYFAGQAILTSLDYVRLGHTNGAADNATGAAAAVGTAVRLFEELPERWEVTLLLTGAEEVAMVGSGAWLRAHRAELDPARTFVLNFDNLGAGKLKIVERTGSLTTVRYDNALVSAARETARAEARFSEIAPHAWRTGDFDTLAFARSGIPSLTLCALDDAGLIPHLHRPTDVLSNVDVTLPAHAVDFACATIARLAASLER